MERFEGGGRYGQWKSQHHFQSANSIRFFLFFSPEQRFSFSVSGHVPSCVVPPSIHHDATAECRHQHLRELLSLLARNERRRLAYIYIYVCVLFKVMSADLKGTKSSRLILWNKGHFTIKHYKSVLHFRLASPSVCVAVFVSLHGYCQLTNVNENLLQLELPGKINNSSPPLQVLLRFP